MRAVLYYYCYALEKSTVGMPWGIRKWSAGIIIFGPMGQQLLQVGRPVNICHTMSIKWSFSTSYNYMISQANNFLQEKLPLLFFRIVPLRGLELATPRTEVGHFPTGPHFFLGILSFFAIFRANNRTCFCIIILVPAALPDSKHRPIRISLWLWPLIWERKQFIG